MYKCHRVLSYLVVDRVVVPGIAAGLTVPGIVVVEEVDIIEGLNSSRFAN